MKHFSIYLMYQVFAPILCCWAIAFTVDPEHVFNHDIENEMVNILKEHSQVSGVCNINERAFKKELVANYEEVQSRLMIFLGSSRIMTVDSISPEPLSYLNLGMSGACYYDIIGCYLMLKESNLIHGNHIIIGLDPWMFTENQQLFNSRWEAFLPQLKANGTLTTSEWVRAEVRRTKNLLKPSSLYMALISAEKKCTPQVFINPEKNTYSGSGVLTYPKHITEKTPQEVKEAIEAYISKDIYKLSDFVGLRGYEKQIRNFEALAHEIMSLNGEVTFVMNPYPTLVYEHLQDRVPSFRAAEYFAQLTLNAQGSWKYSDSVLLETEAFFDGMHLLPSKARLYYQRVLDGVKIKY